MDNLVEEIKEINQENDIFGTYNKAKSICDFLELDSNKEILEKNKDDIILLEMKMKGSEEKWQRKFTM